MITVITALTNIDTYKAMVVPSIERGNEALEKAGLPKMFSMTLSGYDNLAKAYNTAISAYPRGIKVFLHQDVEILHPEWPLKIIKAFEDPMVGLVGCAGTIDLPPGDMWWTRQRYMRIWSGKEKADWRFDQIPENKDMEAVDGMLLATNLCVPFDENLGEGFHFYDMDYSLTIRNNGYKVRLVDIEPWHIGEYRDRNIDWTLYNRKWWDAD